MAGRNNPLISWLGISFDTFNLLHRWFGRIVALEAVTHVLAFFITAAATRGWAATWAATIQTEYLLFGLVVSQEIHGPCPVSPP